MARWIVFTDNVFWKYSWAHVVISITVAFLYVMQCRLRARRSRASSMVFRPWPLRTEIVLDSLNLWMILCTVYDDNFKLFAIFLWETPFWYCSTIFRLIVVFGRLNLFSCPRKYILCCAFLIRALVLNSHLRSWVMMVPRKRTESTVSTEELHRIMGAGGAGFFLKSIPIFTVFTALNSRLCWLHQVTRWSISHLQADSSPSEMSPMRVLSSPNVSSLTDSWLEEQQLVYREKRRWERTQPWGEPVLMVRGSETSFPILTCCFMSDRKSMIHLLVKSGTFNWESLSCMSRYDCIKRSA